MTEENHRYENAINLYNEARLHFSLDYNTSNMVL